MFENTNGSRFEAHEFSEVLRSIVSVSPFSLTLLFGPGHLDFLWRNLHHILLFIGVQTAHTHQ